VACRQRAGLRRRAGPRTGMRLGELLSAWPRMVTTSPASRPTPTTAAVARHLYGTTAEVHHGRFESFLVSDGHFDLVIGKVPFVF